MHNKKVGILFIFFILCWRADAQNFNLTNERTFSTLFNQHIDTTENFHTSIRPFSRNEVSHYDALMQGLNIKSTSKLLSNLSNYDSLPALKNNSLMMEL